MTVNIVNISDKFRKITKKQDQEKMKKGEDENSSYLKVNNNLLTFLESINSILISHILQYL